MTPPHSGKFGDLVSLPAHEVRSLLARRAVSSAELTRAVLDRIEEAEPRVGAFLTVTPDAALKQAVAADLRFAHKGAAAGPLTGIPVMLKDNISTRGVRTTAGSKMLDGYVPPFDATVAARLNEAGAVVVGKGNMDEFAMGSSTENSAYKPCRNPWDLDRVPGGSSGGAAAAVAAGESFISLGSDTGGSIRQPAALCGVVGFKPTYGLVSRFGLIAFASSLDQIGPIARDVRDCADMLGAVAGHDPRDSTSIAMPAPDFLAGLNADSLNGKLLGVPKEYLAAGMEPGTRKVFEEALKTVESLGARVEETSLPMTDHALAVYYIIAPSEASANLARFDGFKYGYSAAEARTAWETMDLTRGAGFGTEVKRRVLLGAYALSAGYYDAYYKKAQQVRSLIRREFAAAFEKFDALVTPTSPTVAFKLGAKTGDPLQMYLSDVCTIPVNIAGLPAISVPCGLSEGMPVGLQLIGERMSDASLLGWAHAYEQATEWHKLRPPI